MNRKNNNNNNNNININNNNSNYMSTNTKTIIRTIIIICNNSKLTNVAQLLMQNSEYMMYILISLSARILHRAPPRLQVDQNFLTQKIVADPKMRCHQKSFGIWRVTEAILGKKNVFWRKNHNKSHYFFNF